MIPVAHSGLRFQRPGAQCFHLTLSVHMTRGKNLSCRQTFSSLCISVRQSPTTAEGAMRAATSRVAAVPLAFLIGVGEAGREMARCTAEGRSCGGDGAGESMRVTGVPGTGVASDGETKLWTVGIRSCGGDGAGGSARIAGITGSADGSAAGSVTTAELLGLEAACQAG